MLKMCNAGVSHAEGATVDYRVRCGLGKFSPPPPVPNILRSTGVSRGEEEERSDFCC
jgi:hypothetical protein